VRLGLINSNGTQDLIVHILARNQRFETANFPNAFIPTNIEVRNNVRGHFGPFYAALFDAARAANPGAVITEYAWQANSCDPCPGPVLSPSDIATLGGDVVGGSDDMNWTLTRLHYRYDRNGLSDDLVFRAAGPMVGGRGIPDAAGRMPQGVTADSVNNFQGRYVILHRWNRPLRCEHPRHGNWGGPPNGASQVQPALNLATQPRGANLSSFVSRPIPGLARRRGGRGRPPLDRDRTSRLDPARRDGTASPVSGRAVGLGAFFTMVLGAGVWIARRKRGA
jgi:hypothetical protein